MYLLVHFKFSWFPRPVVLKVCVPDQQVSVSFGKNVRNENSWICPIPVVSDWSPAICFFVSVFFFFNKISKWFWCMLKFSEKFFALGRRHVTNKLIIIYSCRGNFQIIWNWSSFYLLSSWHNLNGGPAMCNKHQGRDSVCAPKYVCTQRPIRCLSANNC